MGELSGKRVVILLADNYNEFEFWYPKYRLLEAGAEVVVAGAEMGLTYKSKLGMPAKADVSYGACQPEAFHGVVIPGGYAPDLIRRDVKALDLVRGLDALGKVVAFICHAGWVPVSAGILKGRRVTSICSIKDDLLNAGALWQDAEVVVDRNLLSSRAPDDLPAFCRTLVNLLKG
jgi:protease I